MFLSSASDTENIKNDQEQDYQTIMNILLQYPEELDLEHKPSAIRDDNMFTLDRRTVSIESAKADDNGAYVSKGKATKTYWYSEDGARTAHKNENGVWYVNERWHKGYKLKFLACTHMTSGTSCDFRPPCWCSKYQYGGRVLVTNTCIKSRFFPVLPPQNADVPDCGVF